MSESHWVRKVVLSTSGSSQDNWELGTNQNLNYTSIIRVRRDRSSSSRVGGCIPLYQSSHALVWDFSKLSEILSFMVSSNCTALRRISYKLFHIIN